MANSLPRRKATDLQQSRELTLRAMQVFVTVLETGSMSAAAKRLKMTQSSVSQQIANQEELLQTRLLDREVRPLAPTPAGQLYHDHACKVLGAVHVMWADLCRLDFASFGRLRLAIIDSLAEILAPELAQVLDRNLPVSQVTLKVGKTGEHRQALLNRESDLIVTMDAMEDIDGMERHHLFREPFVLATPACWPGDPTKSADLAELPLVRYSLSSQIGAHCEAHLRRLKLSFPNRYEFDTTRPITAMVAQGCGWALSTPTCLLDSSVDRSELVLSPLPFTALSRRVSLVSRENELGGLPAQMAGICRKLVRETCLPRIRAFAPWAAEMIRF